MPPSRSSDTPPPETPFSTKKVKNGGGKSQKCKGFFWWGAARLAVLGGVAQIILFTGNRFELGRIAVPRKNDLHPCKSFLLGSSSRMIIEPIVI